MPTDGNGADGALAGGGAMLGFSRGGRFLAARAVARARILALSGLVMTGLTLAAGLSACGGPTLVPRWNQPGLLTAFLAAAQPGPLAVAVAGNPTALPKAQLDGWVLAGLGRANHHPGARLALDGGDTPLPYRFAVVFDPAPNIGAEELCRQGRRTPVHPATGGHTFLAVFCGPLRPMSEVEGFLPAGSIDQTTVERVLAQSFIYLVPMENDPPQFSRGDF